MACQLLLQIQALPIDLLIALASDLLGRSNLHTPFNTHRRAPTRSKLANLAGLVYYKIGGNLMAEGKWSEMTRLQLQDELRVMGLLGNGEDLSDSQLRSRLASAVLGEGQQAEQKLQEKLRVEGDDKDEEEYGVSDDMETGDDGNDEDDGNFKVIYTKSNGRTMVF